MTIKYLTQKELHKLFRKIDNPRDEALFKLIYYYGLRATEASRLKLSDIRLEDDRINIIALKNGKSGDYIITSEIKKILVKYLRERGGDTTKSEALFPSRKHSSNGGYLSNIQILRLFKRYATKAKLPEDKRHPHVLRHSIAVQMADNGVPVEHVQMHLRHRKIDSTMVYFLYFLKKNVVKIFDLMR